MCPPTFPYMPHTRLHRHTESSSSFRGNAPPPPGEPDRDPGPKVPSHTTTNSTKTLPGYMYVLLTLPDGEAISSYILKLPKHPVLCSQPIFPPRTLFQRMLRRAPDPRKRRTRRGKQRSQSHRVSSVVCCISSRRWAAETPSSIGTCDNSAATMRHTVK